MIHFLRPLTHAFQAHVALGSTWNEEPLRAGPTISHLAHAEKQSEQQRQRTMHDR
jgi:hypothetical protein